MAFSAFLLQTDVSLPALLAATDMTDDRSDLQRLLKLSQDAAPPADVSELDGISQKRSAHNDSGFLSRWHEEKIVESRVLAKTVVQSSDK